MPNSIKRLTAVIDIGSNNVRLVVYGNTGRAPVVVYSDKSVCELGRNLQQTGALNPYGVEKLRVVFPRFISVTRSMQVSTLTVFATAAVREARDGAEILSYLHQASGVTVQVLSGEDEARMAALGVWYGISKANGLVADLGGGSLELAQLKKGVVGRVCSLPIGALRFGDNSDREAVAHYIKDTLERHSFIMGQSYKNLYLVGGAWRAMAAQHMADERYPLHLLHHYTMRRTDLLSFVAPITQGERPLADLHQVSDNRKSGIVVACQALQQMLHTVDTATIVISGYGVREGVLVDNLSKKDRKADALYQSISQVQVYGGIDTLSLKADRLYKWITPVIGHMKKRHRRLVRAGCALVNIARFDHIDHRGQQSLSHILQRPLLDITHRERAFVGYMVAWRYGSLKKGIQSGKAVKLFLSKKQKKRAKTVGVSLQLAYRLSGGMDSILSKFTLHIQGDTLILRGQKNMRHMIRGGVLRALEYMRKTHPHINHFDIELY